MQGNTSKIRNNTKNTEWARNIPKYVVLALALSVMAACGEKRHYLLAVDTSGSMADTRDTIGRVKASIPRLMETVNKGDSVTLLSFDENVAVGRTWTIRSNDDKRQPENEIKAFAAKGAWTDLSRMVQALRDKTKELEKEGGKIIIIVLTDGKDDPAPGTRKEHIDIQSLKDPNAPVKDYFIYYVSLGALADPVLQKRLETIAPNVTTIQAPDVKPGQSAAESTGMNRVLSDLRQKSWFDTFKKYGPIAALIIGGILLILGIILLIRRFLNRNKVAGDLLYYEDGINSPNKTPYNLDRLHSPSVTIGPKPGVNLRIKQLGLLQEFKFRALKIGGKNFLKPVSNANLIQFLQQKNPGKVSSGDLFKIGNYKFEYNDGQENRS